MLCLVAAGLAYYAMTRAATSAPVPPLPARSERAFVPPPARVDAGIQPIPTAPSSNRAPGTAPNAANRTLPSKAPAANREQPAAGRQPGQGRGPRGDRPRDPALHAKFTLMRVFRNIGRLEDEGRSPLTPVQAKAILAIMTPLRAQEKLTATQAADVLAKLEAQLTTAQRDAIAQMRGRRPGGGAGGPRPEGPPPAPNDTERAVRPGGAGGPGGESHGNRPGQSGAAMAEMNPFNPPEEHPMSARMAERWQAIFDALGEKVQQ